MFEPRFPEKADRPDDDALSDALGRSYDRWRELVAHVAEAYPDAVLAWKHYGPKHGWQLKIQQKRRALLYLVPQEKAFLAGMALREAAFPALRTAGLSRALVREIETAKPYLEGYPARVTVRLKRDVDIVEKLLAVKAAT